MPWSSEERPGGGGIYVDDSGAVMDMKGFIQEPLGKLKSSRWQGLAAFAFLFARLLFLVDWGSAVFLPSCGCSLRHKYVKLSKRTIWPIMLHLPWEWTSTLRSHCSSAIHTAVKIDQGLATAQVPVHTSNCIGQMPEGLAQTVRVQSTRIQSM